MRDSHCRGATRQRLLVAGYGRGVVPGRRWARGTGGGEHDTPHRGVCKARQRRQPGNLDHQRPQPSVKCSPSDRVDRDWQRRFRTGGVAVARVRGERGAKSPRCPRAPRPAPLPARAPVRAGIAAPEEDIVANTGKRHRHAPPAGPFLPSLYSIYLCLTPTSAHHNAPVISASLSLALATPPCSVLAIAACARSHSHSAPRPCCQRTRRKGGSRAVNCPDPPPTLG